MTIPLAQMKGLVKSLVQRILFDCPASEGLLTVDQMPNVLKEPFIHTGYRPTHKPWKYYLHSLIRLHNESMNVWTHLFGALAILLRMLSDSSHMPVHAMWPVSAFGITCILNLLLSSAAHLFHSKSPGHHYILFLLDYAAVTIYGLGTGIGQLYLCASPRFYGNVKSWFLVVNALLAWLAFCTCCLAKFGLAHCHTRRKLTMVVGVGTQAMFICSPLAARLYDCLVSPSCTLASLHHTNLIFLLLLLSGITFAAHAPERWLPGSFDIFGHSHQLFHLLSLVAMWCQLRAMRINVETGSTAGEGDPDVRTIFLSLLLVIQAEALTYIYFVTSGVSGKPAIGRLRKNA